MLTSMLVKDDALLTFTGEPLAENDMGVGFPTRKLFIDTPNLAWDG